MRLHRPFSILIGVVKSLEKHKLPMISANKIKQYVGFEVLTAVFMNVATF
jgi:hypothetical protein